MLTVRTASAICAVAIANSPAAAWVAGSSTVGASAPPSVASAAWAAARSSGHGKCAPGSRPSARSTSVIVIAAPPWP